MKKAHFILLFLVIIGTFLSGSWYGRRAVKPDTAGVRRILYYVDPMNPAHTSDKPGTAPCGMALEPVYADGEGGPAEEASPVSSGAVNIGPQKQQMIGVRVSRVEKAPATQVLRVLGWVVPDEERLYRLNAPVDGWMEEVSSVTTGSQVEKGQLLGAFAATDLFLSVQQYVFALTAMDHLSPRQDGTVTVDPTSSNFRQRLESLKNLGMSPLQIEDIRRTREIPNSIKIFAPAAGFVLARNVSSGERFEKGAEWYRIAELSRVWILADVFENEARYLQPGKTVRVTVPGRQRAFPALVSTALPQFDSATRTLKVRLQAENPEFFLRPNMNVDIEFSVELPESITVPADAVIDSGLKATVFVDLGQGRFEPRQVKTGRRSGDRIEIVEGLIAGETIVVSGNFLIDSESRMKLAAAGFHAPPASDPVCGQEIDPDKAAAVGMVTEYEGTMYYFCSRECKEHFDHMHSRSSHGRPIEDGSQSEVSATGASGEQVKHGWVECPVCGMVILEEKARAAGLTAEYEGRTYTFCTRQCKSAFLIAPWQYVKKASRGAESQAAPLKEEQAHD